ncbi:probable helicase senataxin isoform X1 [Nasonia vitripennis]|uniref:FHA domain-containing protein n=1 Tax=Nasonia vitripennis TaxID=7425 RepID=A0A7M7QAC5_NASVI|nr:probable helicase senataxin isoform X1 [Nasonia vitripennis]
MDFERVLKRIGEVPEEVVINKNLFSCGRMNESDLVCLSLLVSRQHCLFTKLPDGLYVTDLGSSNGIYINGKVQETKRAILLNEGDLIGIGCAETTNLDPKTMFVYKVTNRVVLCDSSTSDGISNNRHARKEQSKERRNESNNNDAPANKVARNCSNAVDDDDIEIIENSFNVYTAKSHEMAKKSNSVRQVSECAPNLGPAREVNETTKKKEFTRQITECSTTFGVTEQEASANVKRNEHKKQFTRPEIIDIAEPCISSTPQDDDDIIEIDVTPPRSNVSREVIHTNLTNKELENLNQFIANVNIKQEPQNDPEPIAPTTTIKLEPDWHSFSQIDIVEINDDEGFPSSQLFDRSVVKEESEEKDVDSNVLQTSLFLGDDDNVVTILSSDDDDDDDDVINEDNVIHPIQKIKIESGIEPALEFVDVGVAAHPTITNETNNVCQNNLDVPNYEQVDSTAMLIASLTTEQSLEEQLFALHQETSLESSTSKDPLLDKETSVTNDTLTKKNISTTNDMDTSSNKDTKKSNRKGLEICEPHFIKPKKRGEKSTKRSRSKDRLDRKRKHSSDSSFIKDRHEKSTKNKEYKKDKSTSKQSTKQRSRSKESNNKDKHQSTSSELESHQKKNDENHNKNLSKSFENSSNNSDMLNQSRPKNKTTIVKAKVSTKTRGDMLCEAMQMSRPQPRKEAKAKASEPAKETSAPKLDTTSFVIPRRQFPSSTIPSSSISMISQLNTPTSISPSRDIPSSLAKDPSNDINRPLSPPVGNERSPSPLTESETNRNDVSGIPTSNPNLKSALKSANLNTSQKKVLFKANIAAVREFHIEEGNLLRNIKDGNNLRSSKKDFIGYRTTELKIEDFLARVFAWEPVWLEQQQKIKALPPIVKAEDMQQLPNTFTSFDQYYKRMEVLLLLETWQYLVKEYECTGNRYTTSAVLPCSIVRYSIKQMMTPNKLRYTMMAIHTLVTENQLVRQEHPVYGDMIILEYTTKHGNSLHMRRAFAYVVQVQQQNASKYLQSNDMLRKFVKFPQALLTYFVYTKMIDEQTIQYDQVARLRSIFYIRSHLRLLQGLQYVPRSELCDSILNVDIEQFQLAPVTTREIKEYDLVTKDKLNAKQMEAVIKFTNASVKLEPKIGLLVGPPGTGKSKVIANLVTQILYGEGRYVAGKPLRILVCAPSNAAIDEIVLRLLEIRGAIKEHRFKMVRIGRMESMHAEVKKISVAELARREALKAMSDHVHKISEGIDQKKRKVEDEIRALQLLVANNPRNVGYRMDLDNYRERLRKLVNKMPKTDQEMAKLENAAKMVILQKANVIACTLTSCYTGQMESIFGGDTEKIATCIVDEATQCCEAETLIPLMLGVKSLILVGDPNQLPATIMSTDAKKLGLDRSLFTRAKYALNTQINNERKDHMDPVITLSMQYRMVQAISHWPNRFFYGGKLQDMADYRNNFPFQSYRILNLDGIQDNIKFQNTSEAVFVGNLINSLMTCNKLSSWNRKITVGVITPYQNQKSVIQSTITEQIKNVPNTLQDKFHIEVNTIDSFQGQERDVIVMSLVRSSGIGFLSDPQRLCVALTRAKFTLIICGNFTTFQRDNMWKDLLRDARSRGVVARLNTTARPNEIKPHIVSNRTWRFHRTLKSR